MNWYVAYGIGDSDWWWCRRHHLLLFTTVLVFARLKL
jgi:hypothetical protein